MLDKDTVVYLSIGDSVSEINEKINNTPHNLNGHNLAFLFVIPETYLEDSLSAEYSLNVEHQNIIFSNFFNGTMFIFGDYLHDTYFYDSLNNKIKNFSLLNENKVNKKNHNQISDPIKYDNLNPTDFIWKLYKEIDHSESINDIIYYENDTELETKSDLNKIKIKGTSLNTNYSIMTLSDITAKTYIKNLSFESTLPVHEDYPNVIDINKLFDIDLPTANKVFLEYPFYKNASPKIHDPLNTYLQKITFEPFVVKANEYFKNILNCCYGLKTIMYTKNYIKFGDETNNLTVDGDFISTLAKQRTEILSIPESAGNVFDDISPEDSIPQFSNISIMEALEDFAINYNSYNLTAGDKIAVSGNQLTNLIENFENTFNMIDDFISDSIPSEYVSSYIGGDNEFRLGEFMDSINKCSGYIDEYLDSISALLNKPSFSIFLSKRLDVILSDEILNIEDGTNMDALSTFISLKQIDEIISSAFNGLSSGIKEEVIDQMINIDFSNLSEALTFRKVDDPLNRIDYDNVKSLDNSSDDYLISNIKGSVDALRFNNTSGYLKLDNESFEYSSYYIQHLGKLLFRDSNDLWTDVKQKCKDENGLRSINLYNSQRGTTLTFWTKFDKNIKIDSSSLISFEGICRDTLSGFINGSFVFSIRPTSYSLEIIDGTSSYPLDLLGETTRYHSHTLDIGDIDDIMENNLYSWIMWSIKFDSFSDGETEKKYYTGLQVTAYTFERNNISEDPKFIVKKHNLNTYPMNEANESKQVILSDNYFELSSSQFNTLTNINEFSINLGYVHETDNENDYYYNGWIRNLTMFKGHLTSKEEESLFKLGILNDYKWQNEYDLDELIKLINGGKFFLGLVSIYDSNNINIINCNSKYNGNTYINTNKNSEEE